MKTFIITLKQRNFEEAYQTLMGEGRFRRILVIELYIWAVGSMLLALIAIAMNTGYRFPQ